MSRRQRPMENTTTMEGHPIFNPPMLVPEEKKRLPAFTEQSIANGGRVIFLSIQVMPFLLAATRPIHDLSVWQAVVMGKGKITPPFDSWDELVELFAQNFDKLWKPYKQLIKSFHAKANDKQRHTGLFPNHPSLDEQVKMADVSDEIVAFMDGIEQPGLPAAAALASAQAKSMDAVFGYVKK
jgi:hypothetical protein